jgi:hypothetical protein
MTIEEAFLQSTYINIYLGEIDKPLIFSINKEEALAQYERRKDIFTKDVINHKIILFDKNYNRLIVDNI